MNSVNREEEVKWFLISKGKYFNDDEIRNVEAFLLGINDTEFARVRLLSFTDPIIMFVISVFLGELGVDRFLMGDIAMGFLKLFTVGLCGILIIIDWFTIIRRVKTKNLEKLVSVSW